MINLYMWRDPCTWSNSQMWYVWYDLDHVTWSRSYMWCVWYDMICMCDVAWSNSYMWHDGCTHNLIHKYDMCDMIYTVWHHSIHTYVWHDLIHRSHMDICVMSHMYMCDHVTHNYVIYIYVWHHSIHIYVWHDLTSWRSIHICVIWSNSHKEYVWYDLMHTMWRDIIQFLNIMRLVLMIQFTHVKCVTWSNSHKEYVWYDLI